MPAIEEIALEAYEKHLLTQVDEESDDENSDLIQMLNRTNKEIINSIKKRRVKQADRVTGENLQNLADRIIYQCRIAIS